MDLGLTQRTLALQLGCSGKTVATWERDKAEPLARQWPGLEAALGPGLIPEPVDLAGRVRSARLRLGLTQKALAARAGLDPRTVRTVESARRQTSRRTAERLACALGAL